MAQSPDPTSPPQQGISHQNSVIDILNRGLETARLRLTQPARTDAGAVERGRICPILYVEW
jgi:hypothetical protein